MRIAIKNEWPKESNCKRSKAKNCTINKTMAPEEEGGMGEESRQKGVSDSIPSLSGVCFILCDFDMQLMPMLAKREREGESRRETRTFLRAKESFQSETTTWLKPKVLHTHKHIHTHRHGVPSAPSQLAIYVCLNNLNLYLQSTRLKLAPHTSRTADSFSLFKHNFWHTHTYTYITLTHAYTFDCSPFLFGFSFLFVFFPFFWVAAKYFICNALARCPWPEGVM